jgi:hypothetical protein
MAEHPAVNRRVVGSSPTCGVDNMYKLRLLEIVAFSYFSLSFPLSKSNYTFQRINLAEEFEINKVMDTMNNQNIKKHRC